MPVTTLSAAFYITRVVIQTFLKHGSRKAKKLKDGNHTDEVPQDDILFDEAFHIVKAFIELGTQNTIESLQAFTNTHVPSPYWATVSAVCIPLSSCNQAADILIDWFGPEELKHVVGGERWWQVRGLDGIDAEWIAQKDHLDCAPVRTLGRNLSDSEEDILRMNQLETVMFYVHGGGYFWGSINTHRYQCIKYARKIKGRVFAVNYRKAPQYPWPCPLHDVLAAYIYLIDPPSGALHTPISPSKIVFAGDSAGGGLCISALTVLRDMGFPMPAGAVLISPWVDLTHSFPSVMQNTATASFCLYIELYLPISSSQDIIPEHGFLARPSTLWPMDPLSKDGRRIVPTTTNPPPEPGHTDTLKPSIKRLEEEERADIPSSGEALKTQEEMLEGRPPVRVLSDSGIGTMSDLKDEESSNSNIGSLKVEVDKKPENDCDVESWEPKPPKLLMENPNAVPLELRSQIQQYATTEQLTHPLVSPVLQGSLANLPPLYIIAGDGEVLRDEIIYLAHRAAFPKDYPTRTGVLRDGRRQKENAEKFQMPTKVHLQVFDGMCHVLTVFTFTESANYAYGAIAEFTKRVTHYKEEDNQSHSPDSQHPPLDVSSESDGLSRPQIRKPFKTKLEKAAASVHLDIGLHQHGEEAVNHEVCVNVTGLVSSSDIPSIMMIRERVDIFGKVRLMESQEELPALRVKPCEVGLIKEAPALRWLKGQEIWDKRYKRDAQKVIKRRRQLEAKAERIMKNAVEQGLIHKSSGRLEVVSSQESKVSEHKKQSSVGKVQVDRRWGPLDLENETPPPSAIAKRRDTPEALALLKKSIYHTAPATHHTVPRLKAIDALRAALDPKDDPDRPPQQSVSEQQVRATLILVHGLRMWDGLVRYFGRRTSAKASNGGKHAIDTIKSVTSGMREDARRSERTV
ncbi:hypothetical protein BDQ17DRAFT_1302956 [Cyathus striatus]|nr:hypothetical protein BDQ17DRAFT_1302956 [Cyathus striatus]